MIRRSPVVAVIAMTLVLSAGSAFDAPRAADQPPLPIRIGHQAGADWVLLLARDLKLFEQEGLAPTYVVFEAGRPMIAAAASRSIDVSSLGVVPFVLGISQGVDWVMIGLSEGSFSEGLVAGRDSGIDTPADLKGKRIGYYRGSTAHYGIVLVLKGFGLRADQVTLVHLSPAEQLAALVKKEIDAAMVWEPWIHRMVREAGGRVVAREGELGIYMNVSGLSVRRDWLRDNRETAVRFLRGLLRAYHVLRKDERPAITAGAREMGISDEWAEAIYAYTPPSNMYLWADPRYRHSLAKGSSLDRRLGYLGAFLFDEKIIPKPVDLRNALDASVIAEALKTRKPGQ
jgi:ABC-type nitrate/sulfonate/bicarbonate transport system substrate-binding protein